MKNLLYLLCLLPILITACGNDDDASPALLSILANSNLEEGSGFLPSGWWNSPMNYSIEWTDEEAASGERSIKLSSTQAGSVDFGFWAQTITENVIPGRKLDLAVLIKAEDIVGEGLSLAIRTDNTPLPDGMAEQFFSTQGIQQTINGTFDWQNFAVSLNSDLFEDTQSITVYLIMLPNTTGTAYFDDVRLNYQ
ncbi:MAG: hypothetical protein AAFP19_26015 [Bacteroidota bacterium]